MIGCLAIPTPNASAGQVTILERQLERQHHCIHQDNKPVSIAGQQLQLMFQVPHELVVSTVELL